MRCATGWFIARKQDGMRTYGPHTSPDSARARLVPGCGGVLAGHEFLYVQSPSGSPVGLRNSRPFSLGAVKSNI